MWAVAQNGPDSWSPDLWSKYEWMWDADGELYYCQSTYDAETEEDALSAEGADADDVAAGCGGFSWTWMRGSLDIEGLWSDEWGGSQDVSPFSWNGNAVTQANNEEGWLIAQNGPDSWSPDLWSKYEWTWDADGEAYYCQSTYDAATEEDAVAAARADAGDLDAGCGGFGWTWMRESLDIEGTWEDEWGGTQDVSAFDWNGNAITQAHNDEGWLIAQNGPDSWSPDLWSKYEWTWDADGEAYYCQSTYDAATEEDAVAAARADAGDLDAGCGGFGWTWMRESLDIEGTWEDEWGGTQDVSAFDWNGNAITQAHNDEGWLIAQNGPDSWSPDLWSKYEWTWDEEGNLYYCQSTYDAETEEDAVSAARADAGDLGAGCGGFGWTWMY